MFCPQCGQQQASDVARFCSRCGFQLGAVSNLLATGGAAPEMTMMEAVPSPPSPKRKGVQLGGKLMLSGMFLAPALAALSEITGVSENIALVGVIIIMAGFFRLLYAFLFEDGPYRRQLQRQPTHVPQQHQFAPPREASALPPAQGVPARGYVPPRAETADLAYRPSVTEGTTRLLDRERDESAR